MYLKSEIKYIFCSLNNLDFKLVILHQKPLLPDNLMNNKTKQRPKISILSRLAYNPKKQDNS